MNVFEQEQKKRADPFQTEMQARQKPEAPEKEEDPGFLIGAARTMDDLARAVASGATFGFADEIAAKMNELVGIGDYESNLAQERQRDVGASPYVRIPGETAGMMATAPFGGAGGLLTSAAKGAAAGGLYGFGSGEGGAEERLKSAAIGAGTGGVGGAVGGAVSRLISPKAATDPAIKALTREGITPTPGQLSGVAIRRGEEALGSIPFVGAAVRAGERRAIKEFNETVINRAIRATGKTIKGAGHEAMDEATKVMKRAWDDALKGIQVQMDDAFIQEMRGFVPQAMDKLDDGTRKVLVNKMNKVMGMGAMKDPTMAGREAQKIISELGREARKFSASDSAFQRTLGETYEGVRQAMVGLMQRNTTPENAMRLAQLRKTYPEWLVVQKAAAAQGAKEGIFSPAQYLHAVRSTDPTRMKTLYGRGGAAGQKLGKAADKILGKTVPDSGTPERALWAALFGGGVAGQIDPLTGLAVGGSMAASTLPYTPLLQKAIAQAMTQRPAGAQAAAKVAERMGLGAGLGAASYYTGP